MTTRTWVLGASDPEMAAAEQLLRECGEQVMYATIDGRRVRPSEAYRATGPYVHGDIVLVECDGPFTCVVGRCDHHRLRDAGFGQAPDAFLRASSLGQVIALLARDGLLPASWRVAAVTHGRPTGAFVRVGPRLAWHVEATRPDAEAEADVIRWTPDHQGDDSGAPRTALVEVPDDLVLCAAADHCLGAAYRGACPGVNPDVLMRWRAASRAAFQQRPVDALLADVAAAMVRLTTASWLELAPSYGCEYHSYPKGTCDCNVADGGAWVRDMRGPVVPELPEAALRLGVGYVTGPLVGPDGRTKFTCSGTPEEVEAFISLWALEEGLVDVYGDPARGFAGAYQVTR